MLFLGESYLNFVETGRQHVYRSSLSLIHHKQGRVIRRSEFRTSHSLFQTLGHNNIGLRVPANRHTEGQLD